MPLIPTGEVFARLWASRSFTSELTAVLYAGESGVCVRRHVIAPSNPSFVSDRRRDLRRWRLQGPIMAAVTAKTGRWRLEIVNRNAVVHFEVPPKRWVVERTLAWISHCRRLARDFERHVRTVVAFVYLALIRLTLRRLTATASA
jgi:hypothetical protein